MLNRRQFLKVGIGSTGAALAGALPVQAILTPAPADDPIADRHIRDYLTKMERFDEPHTSDLFLSPMEMDLLTTALARLHRLQRLVGHGNFYILGFDKALSYARSYSRVGAFSEPEVTFLEKIFFAEGSQYGFLGKKPLAKLTDRIRKNQVYKVPGTGNYLYKGRPQEIYQQIRSQIGDRAVLTSGVRSIIKQFMLFLEKVATHNGNLSLASRSLAPPGYSFHGIGDFDVGQVGFGVANFTERFTTTTVYQRLCDLGFLQLRYPSNNFVGVRFEPWHIKVDPC